MVELPERSRWNHPVVLMAFEGWNDAGDAASGTLEHLLAHTDSTMAAEMDPEPYYDFQVARPTIRVTEEGVSDLRWPGVRVHLGHQTGSSRDIILVHGIEPSMRWPTFARELTQMCQDVGAEMVVLLGALLADVPHRKALPVNGVAGDTGLRERLGLQPSNYEGPSGILGVLQDQLARRAIPVVSLWAEVPYYVAQPPCPKASLALLEALEGVIDLGVPTDDLEERVRTWEDAVEEIVAEDPEIAELVDRLEKEAEATLSPASGDSIAREFERYLRGHDERDT